MANEVAYSEAFAGFILECKDAWGDFEAQIDRGEVPADKQVTLRITIPPRVVDMVRQDRLRAAANGRNN